MKNIDKALLIKELRELTLSLEHRSLTLFETAKTQKRIRDIFTLCNDPIFQQYLPKDFVPVEQKPNHPKIENDLVKYPSVQNRKQIMPSENDTELLTTESEAENLPIAEQQDTEIQDNAVPPSVSENTEKSEPKPKTAPQIKAVKKEKSTQVAINKPEVAPTIATSNQVNTPEIAVTNEDNLNVRLNGEEFKLDVIINLDDTRSKLYRIHTQNSSKETKTCEILLNNPNIEPLLDRPIFIAEQLDEKGKFNQYLIFLGTKDPSIAIQSLQTYSKQNRCDISAIREFTWSNIQNHIFNFEKLFEVYVSNNNITWQKPNAFAFIPKNLISSQKFIQFDEAEASVDTPIILLKERQKIRLICGKKRLDLFDEELAYPYVLFDRQQGLNWQTIQETVSSLSQPVVSLTLLDALNKILDDNT